MVAQVRKIEGEIARREEPLLGILRETPFDDPAQRDRRKGGERADRLRLVPDDRRERLGGRAAGERALSREHLVEDGPERKLVGAEIDRPAARLLGRHVADGPEHDSRPRGLAHRFRSGEAGVAGLDELGQAEVENLHEAVLRDHEVLGLQIAVDDPGGVRLREGVRDLRGDRENPFGRKRPSRDELTQSRSLDELHRDPRNGAGLADLVDRDDVRVVQRRGGARLLLEAGEPVRVGRERLRQHLDRDFAAQPRIARLVHLSHAQFRAHGRRPRRPGSDWRDRGRYHARRH